MRKAKLSKYQQDPNEYDRVVRILSGGMKESEIKRFFIGLDSYTFLKALGDPGNYTSEGAVVKGIIRVFAENRVPKDPWMPGGMSLEPEPDDQETPDMDAPQCTGECGGVSKVRQMLRWKKALAGQPVTVSINMKNMPKIEGLTKEAIIQECMKWQAVAPTLDLKFLTKGTGDIHIDAKFIDGEGDERGNILGIAYQPRSGFDMEAGGMVSGDIFIDNGDLWALRGLAKLLLTLRHEFGHGLGAPHLGHPGDTMFDRPTALPKLQLSNNDAEWAGDAYPQVA